VDHKDRMKKHLPLLIYKLLKMISGLSFAQRCDWTFDYRYDFRKYNGSMARDGDWIFINGDCLFQFRRPMNNKFNWVRHKYNFIVHNSDRSFGYQELAFLLPIAYRIYAINTTVSHPILKTIPIGFADIHLPFLKTFNVPKQERTIEIYANFQPRTNVTKRQECIDCFKDNPKVVFRDNLTVEEYFNDLSKSKFVLCPEGTGIDTHRIYESLLCGATPVVLRNPLSNLYERMPVCIVDKWTDPFEVKTGNISFNHAFYI